LYRFTLAFLLVAVAASAATLSTTGTLATPEEYIDFQITIGINNSAITLQTYGFGGGTNHLGDTIVSGGFDSFVGLFEGSGSDAAFIAGSSDILSDFSPGCPPAGTLTVGSVTGQCGDDFLHVTGLAKGTYTAILSDGSYVPTAVFETSGLLGDGFSDLTNGVFQTCADIDNCNVDTGNWAMDITVPEGATVVSVSTAPEPGSGALLGICFAVGAVWQVRRKVKRAGDNACFTGRIS